MVVCKGKRDNRVSGRLLSKWPRYRVARLFRSDTVPRAFRMDGPVPSAQRSWSTKCALHRVVISIEWAAVT